MAHHMASQPDRDGCLNQHLSGLIGSPSPPPANNTETDPVFAASEAAQVVAGDKAKLDGHIGSTANPHGVTAAQTGADPAGTASAALQAPQAEAAAHAGAIADAIAEHDISYQAQAAHAGQRRCRRSGAVGRPATTPRRVLVCFPAWLVLDAWCLVLADGGASGHCHHGTTAVVGRLCESAFV